MIATVWRKQPGQHMAQPAQVLLIICRTETKDGGDVLSGSLFTRSMTVALWLHRGLSRCLMFPVLSVSTIPEGHPLWACPLT